MPRVRRPEIHPHSPELPNGGTKECAWSRAHGEASCFGTPPAVCPYVYLDLLNYPTDFDAVFFLKREWLKRKIYLLVVITNKIFKITRKQKNKKQNKKTFKKASLHFKRPARGVAPGAGEKYFKFKFKKTFIRVQIEWYHVIMLF
jgi:hypothetical protein